MTQLKHIVQETKRWERLYRTYRHYWSGRHQLMFASEDFSRKYGPQVQQLRENLCQTSVQVFTDRLQIQDWGADGLDTAALDLVLGYVHDEAFRCGDAYVLVWPGPDGSPVAHYQAAGDMVPHVNPTDPTRLDWAAKPWIDPDQYGRLTIYDSTGAYRYRTLHPLPAGADTTLFPTDPTDWVPHEDEDGPEVIPHEFGRVPVCWWGHGAPAPGTHGVSILADVIPLQDALNKTLADMVVTGEAYARPFRYLLSYRPTTQDPTVMAGDYMRALDATRLGPARKYDPQKQQIFTHDGPGPFGQLDPPDVTELIRAKESYATAIARVLGVPPFYMMPTSGDVPSGEALRVLASRMVGRIRKFQRASTPAVKGLAELLGADDPVIVWEPPLGLDETERWERAQVQHGLGLALVDILRMVGVADPEALTKNAAAAQQTRLAETGKLLRDGHLGY